MQHPQFGLCVPSTCSDADVMNVYNRVLKNISRPVDGLLNDIFGDFQIDSVHSHMKGERNSITTAEAICM